MFMNFFGKTNKILVLILSFAFFAKVYADVPITTDNRIKTFIYNENEVYKVLVYNGYQCSIELADGESITTLSIGDSYSWKITPVGRRLFIKPLEDNIHTNMTIITNKRAYQFDVLSKKPDANIESDLVYVLRFFYPD